MTKTDKRFVISLDFCYILYQHQKTPQCVNIRGQFEWFKHETIIETSFQLFKIQDNYFSSGLLFFLLLLLLLLLSEKGYYFSSSKTSSRGLQNIFKTSSRHLQDVFKTSWKMRNCKSWKTTNYYAAEVFKTFWVPKYVCWVWSPVLIDKW